jgi:hypothetical protein
LTDNRNHKESDAPNQINIVVDLNTPSIETSLTSSKSPSQSRTPSTTPLVDNANISQVCFLLQNGSKFSYDIGTHDHPRWEIYFKVRDDYPSLFLAFHHGFSKVGCNYLYENSDDFPVICWLQIIFQTDFGDNSGPLGKVNLFLGDLEDPNDVAFFSTERLGLWHLYLERPVLNPIIGFYLYECTGDDIISVRQEGGAICENDNNIHFEENFTSDEEMTESYLSFKSKSFEERELEDKKIRNQYLAMKKTNKKSSFQDTTGYKSNTFTGASSFHLAEMEVFARKIDE